MSLCQQPAVLLLLLPLLRAISTEETLKMVQMVWRHGQRTPYTVLPDFCDPDNQADTWPEGLGELTQTGISESYKMGSELSDRYGALLNFSFKADKVRCHSGDENRTIATAQLVLMGLFPDHQLATVPTVIPVHSRPLIDAADGKLIVKKICPNYFWVMNIEPLRKLNEKYANVFKYLSEKTGLEVKHAFIGLDDIRDVLLGEKNTGHKWPNWVSQSLFTQIDDCYAEARYIITDVSQVVRMSGGFLLRQILDEFKFFLSGKSPRKFFGYSAHDQNVAFLGKALRVTLETWPSYNAYISIELHQKQNQNTIEVWYSAGTGNNLTRLEIADCPQPCDFADFAANSQPYLAPKNWLKACGLISEKKDTHGLAIGILAALAALFLGTTLLFGFCFCKQRRFNQERMPLLYS